MTIYPQLPLTEIIGTGTVDTDKTSQLFAELICSIPKKKDDILWKTVKK